MRCVQTISGELEKLCTDCDAVFPVAAFSKNRAAVDGFTNICRACQSRRNAKNYEKNRAAIIEKAVAYNRTHREARRKYTRNYKHKHRANNLRRLYGLSVQAHSAMLVAQRGVCAVCKKPEQKQRDGVLLPLAVDHNHTTGLVRGLLCSTCNRLLGRADDDVELLNNAAVYLVSPPANLLWGSARHRVVHTCSKHENPKLYYLEADLARRYGLTIAGYSTLYERQNGLCAICRKPETRKLKNSVVRLSVDHKHSDLTIRGLLCNRCNSMLGMAADDPKIFRSAAAYLEKHRYA